MNTKELIALLQNDPETVKTISELNDPEKVYEVLKGKGLTDSFEDFKKSVAEMKEDAGKMSEADVDAIVGGGDTITTLTTVTTITASASAAV